MEKHRNTQKREIMTGLRCRDRRAQSLIFGALCYEYLDGKFLVFDVSFFYAYVADLELHVTV